MQRRAAAVFAVVLLIVAAGAYVFIGFTQEPTVAVDGEELGVGDSITVDGRTYDVTDIGPNEATLAWTNDSARMTAEIENDTNVTYQGSPYHLEVLTVDADPSRFRIQEVHNVTAILQADPDVENSVLRSGDGTKYVRYRSNGSTRELNAYLPPRRNATFSQGDSYPYENRTTTVHEVTNETVTLEWRASETIEVGASEGGNVTLGSTRYLAHLPDNSTLILTQNYEAYAAEQQQVAYYHERVDGLWGVSILSTLAAIILLGAAYMPSRY